MSNRVLHREDRGPIAVLTLNRPERRNALSRELLAELRDAVERVGVDVAIRALVLTGAGSAFCAGMDLKEAAEVDADPHGEQTIVEILKEFADLLQCIHTLPKPTIAAVNGDALAGGAGVMAACDLVVAAETARIGYPEVRRGLVAAIVMHDLTRQVGDRRARQLLLTGDLISSKVAQDWGLVNAVTPADRCLEEAVRVGQGLVECAPSALGATKRLLDEATGRPPNLRGAAAISAVVRASEEAIEGIRAFVAKRPPRWAVPSPAPQARAAANEAARAAQPGREEPTIHAGEP
jgi:methylglutaconyl-CoA hydratase